MYFFSRNLSYYKVRADILKIGGNKKELSIYEEFQVVISTILRQPPQPYLKE
jgi:hypothetical protein